jgi:steroid delta-isomerase
MPTREEICARCDAYVAGVAAHDTDAIVALFAADATQEEPVGSVPQVGHEQIRAFFAASEEVSFTVRRIGPVTVSGRVAAFQIRVDFEGGAIAPFTSTDVVTFGDDGLISSIVAIPDLDAHPDRPPSDEAG